MNSKIILSIINILPGIRYKELQRITKMPNGTLSYHLEGLERKGLIRIRRDNGSTRIFPLTFDDYAIEIISIIKDSTRLKIIKYLLKHKSATYQELHNATGKSFSTLSWHLDKLIDNEIIKVNNYIGINEYSLKEPEIIEEIVKIIDKNVTDNFIDLWNEL